jgi:hypothetical protein
LSRLVSSSLSCLLLAPSRTNFAPSGPPIRTQLVVLALRVLAGPGWPGLTGLASLSTDLPSDPDL